MVISKKRGFTLIELLISISILVILLLIAIGSYNTYDRRNNLILTADSLKSFIDTARQDAKSRPIDQEVDNLANQIEIITEVNTEGLTDINEYRAVKYPNTTEFSRLSNDDNPTKYRTLKISKRISINPPSTPLTISSPDGAIQQTGDMYILESLPDKITITVNENSTEIIRDFH